MAKHIVFDFDKLIEKSEGLVRLRPGVMDTLLRLYEDGTSLAFISTNPREWLRNYAYAFGIGQIAQALVGSDDIEPGSNAMTTLLRANGWSQADTLLEP